MKNKQLLNAEGICVNGNIDGIPGLPVSRLFLSAFIAFVSLLCPLSAYSQLVSKLTFRIPDYDSFIQATHTGGIFHAAPQTKCTDLWIWHSDGGSIDTYTVVYILNEPERPFWQKYHKNRRNGAWAQKYSAYVGEMFAVEGICYNEDKYWYLVDIASSTNNRTVWTTENLGKYMLPDNPAEGDPEKFVAYWKYEAPTDFSEEKQTPVYIANGISRESGKYKGLTMGINGAVDNLGYGEDGNMYVTFLFQVKRFVVKRTARIRLHESNKFSFVKRTTEYDDMDGDPYEMLDMDVPAAFLRQPQEAAEMWLANCSDQDISTLLDNAFPEKVVTTGEIFFLHNYDWHSYDVPEHVSNCVDRIEAVYNFSTNGMTQDENVIPADCKSKNGNTKKNTGGKKPTSKSTPAGNKPVTKPDPAGKKPLCPPHDMKFVCERDMGTFQKGRFYHVNEKQTEYKCSKCGLTFYETKQTKHPHKSKKEFTSCRLLEPLVAIVDLVRLQMMPVMTENGDSCFYVATMPITQGQWAALFPDNDRGWKNGSTYPAVNVTYEDVTMFISSLNHRAAMEACPLQFRLPTREEWILAYKNEVVSKDVAISEILDSIDGVAYGTASQGVFAKSQLNEGKKNVGFRLVADIVDGDDSRVEPYTATIGKRIVTTGNLWMVRKSYSCSVCGQRLYERRSNVTRSQVPPCSR